MPRRRVSDAQAAAAAAATSRASAMDMTLRQLADSRVADTRSRGFWSDDPVAGARLDARTGAIVRIAALIAVGASAASYRWSVEAAQDAGVTDNEVLGVLLTVAPRVGLARLVSAVIPLALAIGYNIDVAFETLDPDL